MLANGENKVEMEIDTRRSHCLSWMAHDVSSLMSAGIPSSAIFTFNKEDHTLGNMLRARLLQSSHVLFAAYKVCATLLSAFCVRIEMVSHPRHLGSSPAGTQVLAPGPDRR